MAQDIVDNFGERISALDGKAMVVWMSRRIGVELISEVVRLGEIRTRRQKNVVQARLFAELLE